MAEEMKADAGRTSMSTGVPEIVSVLPLRDAVLFPYAVMPLGAGRDSSVRLIEDAMSGSHRGFPPVAHEPIEAGASRHRGRQGSAGAPGGRPHQGSRGAGARLEDTVAGRVRSGEGPARLLSPRAAQGDPKGARADRRA